MPHETRPADIYENLAAIGYALDCLPRWLLCLRDGSLPPEAVDRNISSDLVSAAPAFEQLKSQIYDLIDALENQRDVTIMHARRNGFGDTDIADFTSQARRVLREIGR